MTDGEVPIEEMIEYYLRHNTDVEQCEGCSVIFKWDKLPDENVKTEWESRGEFWGAPCSERVVVGWQCPGCGHYNSM
jgi:hypothetical protein